MAAHQTMMAFLEQQHGNPNNYNVPLGNQKVTTCLLGTLAVSL